VLFIALKHLEMERGSVRLADGVRMRLDSAAENSYVFVLETAPKKILHWMAHIMTSITHFCSIILLHVIRQIEYRLVNFVHTIRGRRELHRRKASSSYLEDVSNHKREVNDERTKGYYEN